jgi:hypothetical protein
MASKQEHLIRAAEVEASAWRRPMAPLAVPIGIFAAVFAGGIPGLAATIPIAHFITDPVHGIRRFRHLPLFIPRSHSCESQA